MSLSRSRRFLVRESVTDGKDFDVEGESTTDMDSIVSIMILSGWEDRVVAVVLVVVAVVVVVVVVDSVVKGLSKGGSDFMQSEWK